MKRVFMCDFCHEYSSSQDKIKDHEDKCQYNPKNKKCASCRNYEEFGMPISGSSMECNIKSKVLNWFDIQDDNLSCEFHEKEI